MSPALESRFVIVSGYWVPRKDIRQIEPDGVRLNSGRFIKGETS